MRMSFKHSDNPTLTVTSEDMNPSSLFRFISPFDQSSVVEFQCSNSSHVSGDEAVTVVQQLSSCIEKFKTRALLMQAEQDSLLMALTLAKDKYCQISSKDGAASKIKSLMKSLSDVDVKVSTARTMQEDEALHRINSLIDQLVYQVQGNERERKTICNNYIKLCSSGFCVEMSETCETSDGSDFHSLITKCTVDDQNRVCMRLTGLLAYLNSLEEALK